MDKCKEVVLAIHVMEVPYLYNKYVAYLRDTGVAVRVVQSKLVAATKDFSRLRNAGAEYPLKSLEGFVPDLDKISSVVHSNAVTLEQLKCVDTFEALCLGVIRQFDNRVSLKTYLRRVKAAVDQYTADITKDFYTLRKEV